MGVAPIATTRGQSHNKDKTRLNKTTILLRATVGIKYYKWWLLEEKLSSLLPSTMKRTSITAQQWGDQRLDL